MRNLENAVYFEMPAVPFVLEKDFSMHFGDTIFEPTFDYEKTSELLKNYHSGIEIEVQYSIHNDRNYPYKKFKIHYDSGRNVITGRKI